jgi:ADP-ribose pyrophosphatase YjhB (NUDIX family)
MIGDPITRRTKYEEIYLSRRVDTPIFPKKWQFVNGPLRGQEESKEAALRVLEEQTGIYATKDRLHFLHSIQLTETEEFYYLFLMHLRPTEAPIQQVVYKKFYSDWRAFKLEKAVVLDLVPGIRTPIRKLLITLTRIKANETRERALAF